MNISNTKIAVKAALASAALTIAAGSVQAESQYVFTAIDTKRHGADVVDGNYAEAIARIRKDGKTDLGFSESTNLCIAYTKSGDSASALQSCNRAVEIARQKNAMPFFGRWDSSLRSHADLDLVIALSNRGVVHVTNSDYELAMQDLQEAKALKPQYKAVNANLARVEEKAAKF